MESGHSAEVLGEHFAAPGLQRLDEVIDCVLVLFLMSSNFIVFPFRAVSGLFFSSPERQREKTRRNGAKGRTEAGGGWQGVRESAVRDKPLLIYGLARNRRSPKRPSEPRPSGVHPEEGEVGRKTA
jgi:hypothetical protein